MLCRKAPVKILFADRNNVGLVTMVLYWSDLQTTDVVIDFLPSGLKI